MGYEDEVSKGLGPVFGSAASLLAAALPLYLGAGLAVVLVLGWLSGRGRTRGGAGALRPFWGYAIGLLTASILALTFGDLVLGVFLSDAPPLGIHPLVWLATAGAVALCVGLLAGLVAGAFEVLLAPLSVWIGAALGLGARFASGLEVRLFEPALFSVMAPFAVFALLGGVAAYAVRRWRRVARPLPG